VKSWRCFPDKFGKEYDMREIMSRWKDFDRSLTFHGITYRTDFYRKYSIQLSENVFYEDHEYATFPCCHAKTVMPLDLFIYQYRVGDVSQSVSDSNQLKRISHTKTVLERMVSEKAHVTDEWGLAYCEKKIHLLLLSFLVTSLLCDPDKRQGRERGREIMEEFEQNDRTVYDMSIKHYKILRTLNMFHISRNTYNKILKSKLYNTVRNNKSFD
jgi:hypothetical protein